jgi:transcriptional regulator with XRE-family HTH domain
MAMRRGIGAQMLAARTKAGLTQTEVARRMGTKGSSISRVEAGRVRASIDFLERFARALGRPMNVSFGDPTVLDSEERWERARRNFRFFAVRYGALFPTYAARVGLNPAAPFDATGMYQFSVEVIAHSGESRKPWTEPDPNNLEWPSAIASIWYDSIDWASVKAAVTGDRKVWRADIKVRKKARAIVAERGP